MRSVQLLGRYCAHHIHRRLDARRKDFRGRATSSWGGVLALTAATLSSTAAGAAGRAGVVALPDDPRQSPRIAASEQDSLATPTAQGGGPQLFGFIHAQFEDPEGSGETRPFARRMRLGLRGDLAQHLGYEVSAELTASDTDLPRSAFVEYRSWRPALLRVGEFKLPYSLEAYESSNVNQFTDRAMAVEQIAFTHDRDTGFSARSPADPRRLYSYHLALVNGAGRNQLRATDVKLFVGRVHFHIAPPFRPGGSPLALGFSTRQGSVRNFNRPAGEQDEDERYGVDLEYQRGRWHLRGE